MRETMKEVLNLDPIPNENECDVSSEGHDF